jgi:hypothetical protein
MPSRQKVVATTTADATTGAAMAPEATSAPSAVPVQSAEGASSAQIEPTASPANGSGNGADDTPHIVDVRTLPESVRDPVANLGSPPPRRRGRPLGSKTRRDLNPDPDQASRPAIDSRGEVVKPRNFRAMAVTTVNAVTGACEQFGGEIWKPSESEQRNLWDATEVYFREKNIPDIPPGWMLFLVVMAYATPRLNHPETQAKLARLRDKVLGNRMKVRPLRPQE